MTEKTPEEWPIGELYSKAYKIAIKNPVLWWFAIAIGATLGSGYSGGNNIDASDVQSVQKLFHQSGGNESTSKVLGDAINPVQALFVQIINTIPWYFYAILISEIVLFIISAIVIGVIYKAWAEASLLNGIEDSIEERKPTMHEMSEKAFPMIKSFIWLQILPGLAFWFISFVLLGMLVFLFILVPGNLKVLIGILLFFGVITFLVGLLYLTIALIWAPRKVVTDKLPALAAFMVGIHIAKKKFWKTILFGILNNLVSLLVMVVAIVIPVVIFIILAVIVFAAWKGLFGLSVALMVLMGILAIIWIVALALIGGILTSFKAGFWSLAYHKIREKYEH